MSDDEVENEKKDDAEKDPKIKDVCNDEDISNNRDNYK